MLEKNQNGHILELYIQTNEANSLDATFFRTLKNTLIEAEQNKSVKAILLSTKSEKYFSNGFNPEIFIGKSLQEIRTVLQDSLEVAGKILFCERPIVCAMPGHAMGLGAVYAIFCDYRIMVEKGGRIGFPESQIGINFPSTSGLVLKELVGARAARDLLYSGRALKSDEALQLGLIDHSCKPGELLSSARKWCAQFENMALESVVGIKAGIRDSLKPFVESQQKRDIELLGAAIHSRNGQEGMKSIVEKRRPVFV
ncbi:enoyl-CoA hydratase [Leptospira perolatii]|uniref:Enoyl-CoA hydratase n=1 Tax=Leptospira perolatii TaxID=2023191 RepID=A0A2M9ZMT6_9LEPT|nr:enoyl-CoA hydratase/isomerase family protein [Leptospira perolatii]PJZ68281.1 enoyl-CoA hydratase [Leptospira perolatii]PJZ73368.1 enoyl-CoA hydratase [Leptospira perolatii]